MLLNPERNYEFKNFLNEFYSKISFLTNSIKQSQKDLEEFKWAIVLNYLLLKSLGPGSILHNYVKEKLPEVFENYIPIVLFKLNDRGSRIFKQLDLQKQEKYLSFFENYLVNPYILSKNLYTMRTDIDLKILFTLFGGRFLPQEQKGINPSGALYFTREDSKEGTQKKKINILKNHFEYVREDKIPCIALNKGAHWVALDNVKFNFLYFNDPKSKNPTKWGISRYIPQSFCFYLFYYNPNNAFIFNEDVSSFLEEEIEKERIAYSGNKYP